MVLLTGRKGMQMAYDAMKGRNYHVDVFLVQRVLEQRIILKTYGSNFTQDVINQPCTNTVTSMLCIYTKLAGHVMSM